MAIIKGAINPVISGTTTFPEGKAIQVTAPNRHSVRPSLVLDFANSKTLDPRITFTRGSSATYYDGSTALAEQNLLTYTDDFSSGWGLARATRTANATTAPDGSSNAVKLTQSGSGTYGPFYRAVSGATQPHTASVYAKVGTGTWIALWVAEFSSGAYFNISTGVVGTVSSATATITSVGNGWYRCTVTANVGNSPGLFVGSVNGDGSNNGSDGVYNYFWGAQLEQRSAASAYTSVSANPVSNYIPVLKTAGANQPRFDVDPITLESKGLLIEEQRTNLLSWINHSNWVAASSININTNVAVAPDGTVTAAKLVAPAASAQHYTYHSYASASVQPYTYSAYAKAGEYTYINLDMSDNVSGDASAIFNLANGTVTSSSFGTNWTNGSTSIVPVGNGWYRCSVTATRAITGSSFLYSYLYIINNSVTSTFTGNGWNGVYVWGVQLEAGAFASSYIPTTTSSVTRAVESISLSSPNFSWFNPKEGTLYYETSKGTHLQDGRVYWQLDQGVGGAGYQQILYSSYNTGGNYYPDTQVPTGSNAAGPNRAVFAYTNQGGRSMCLNGSTVVVSTDNTYPNFTTTARLVIGAPAQACVKKLSFYPVRLSSAELQGLTTA